MNSLFRIIAAMVMGLAISPTCHVQADHGHVIHRDHDGNCSNDDDCDEDDCDSESEDESCHAWVHGQKEIEPGYEDEDLTYEVEQETGWPSKRENFSEMFR